MNGGRPVIAPRFLFRSRVVLTVRGEPLSESLLPELDAMVRSWFAGVVNDSLRDLRHAVSKARRALLIAERKLRRSQKKLSLEAGNPSPVECQLEDPDVLLARKLAEDRARAAKLPKRNPPRTKSRSVRTVSGGACRPR